MSRRLAMSKVPCTQRGRLVGLRGARSSHPLAHGLASRHPAAHAHDGTCRRLILCPAVVGDPVNPIN
eukprot:4341982-Heterocapsa_arctica.AAC.1